MAARSRKVNFHNYLRNYTFVLMNQDGGILAQMNHLKVRHDKQLRHKNKVLENMNQTDLLPTLVLWRTCRLTPTVSGT
jgi:hypothetical protein